MKPLLAGMFLGLALVAIRARWIAVSVVCPRCVVRDEPLRLGRCAWCAHCGYAIVSI